MRYPHQDKTLKESVYRVARHGVVGSHLLPIVDELLDRLSQRIHAKVVAVIVGGLFLAFVVTGNVNSSHRETLIAEKRYSDVPTAQFTHRYAIGRYKLSNGSRRWVGETYTMFVTPGDAFLHRMWKSLRSITGWALVIAVAAAGIAWWRRGQREMAVGAFGEGTPEYEEYLYQRSPEGHHQRHYRNDWLVNDVPEEGEKAFRRGGDRPQFGRKRDPSSE